MAATARIDELRRRYAAQPRRYLAPLANVLRQSGAIDEAVTMLRAQLAAYPEHLTGHVVLGQALFDTGALADARGAFEAARALDPGNRVVLRYLGEIASLGGDQAAARRWFGRLRAADPYADDVAAQLGGGPTEPPDADDDDVPGAGPAVTRDVQEVRGSDEFERLDFDPVSDAAADVAAAIPDRSTPPDGPALDPVVGLDVAPSASPPELDAAFDAAGSSQHSAHGAERTDEFAEPEPDEAAPGAFEHITAGPFATETMAGLLATQGHTEQAIALYERLTAERPGDVALRTRLDALRGTRGSANAASLEASERYTSSATDAERGALLAAAFADLSARGVARPRFAEPVAGSGAGAPREDGIRTEAAVPEPDADLARFDEWLRDLAA
ncbi:hypothetical protein tb265_35910 [Gemmatimonadetes bacterium T265]|nr:hypothetical protein tb265_35910 [Gemmatimonadetes bacterium T265]